MGKAPKPEPTPSAVICTICDQTWGLHPEDPDVMDCIDLLKAELARRSQWSFNSSTTTAPYQYS